MQLLNWHNNNLRARQQTSRDLNHTPVVVSHAPHSPWRMEEKVYHHWGDSEEDDITKLPKNWEARVASDGRLYFLK